MRETAYLLLAAYLPIGRFSLFACLSVMFCSPLLAETMSSISHFSVYEQSDWLLFFHIPFVLFSVPSSDFLSFFLLVGKWSRRSELWSRRSEISQILLAHTPQTLLSSSSSSSVISAGAAVDEGCFWMELADFLTYFSSLFVCKLWIGEGMNWQHLTLAGKWRKHMGNCGMVSKKEEGKKETPQAAPRE